MALVITLYPHQTAVLFGSDEYLKGMAAEYLFWYSISLPITILLVALPFFVRQTNPNFAMWAMVIATIVNIVLDYVFIFVFEWGLFGAAIATNIGEAIGALLLFIYLLNPKVAVRFAKLKMSVNSIRLTARNTWYMIKLGVSSCLSEVTIAIMAITGNYVFMRHLGADGVAAYSIICYLFPIIFMVFNSIVQSAQPIISYNYGCGQMERSDKATRLSLAYAITFALLIISLFSCFSEPIISLFLPNKSGNAWKYAAEGLPLFASDYIFFGINVIAIGYYTGIERIRRAIGLTILRGILPVVFFFTLPTWFGIFGIWISVATGDAVTTVVIAILLLKDKLSRNSKPITTSKTR